MIIDAHSHIFTPRVVENVEERPDMREELKLNTRGALRRLNPRALQHAAETDGVDVCVLLPTAAPDKVRAENDRFLQWNEEFSRIKTLATLHPAMEGLRDEVLRMFDRGVRGFKFSSFSQRFDLSSLETETMLGEVERLGRDRSIEPIVVFDTFARADVYYHSRPDYLTRPHHLADLARRHPGINVVGAHMGGLLADFDEMRRALLPARNLYLDTANAAHTLEEHQFIELLRLHGPSHILFGTDWPWFGHGAEREKIGSLLVRANYTESDHAAVFGGNAQRLLGL